MLFPLTDLLLTTFSNLFNLLQMKRFNLALFLSLLLSSVLFSQNCKYEVNEFDEFTKKYTKETKYKQIAMKWKDGAALKFKKVGEEVFFIFTYSTVIKKKSTALRHIKKGYKLFLLFEGGETIEIAAIDDMNGYKNRVGIPLAYSYTCLLSDIHYSITKDQLQKIIENKIQKFRFELDDFNGRKQEIDWSINNNNSDNIRFLAKCVF